jgi:DNA-binding CsgD family transcriptional regulator
LSDQGAQPVRLALAVSDPELADRLVELLSMVPGIELVGDVASADAVIGRPAVVPLAVDFSALTARELEVLALLAEGASNKTIARRLGISVHTAKFHVSQLLDKLDATGRTNAVTHAARRGVLNL